VHRVQIDRGDIVDLTRDQRVLARGIVEDQKLFDTVEIGQSLFPVAVVAAEIGAHAELDIVDPEGPAAIRRGRVDRAVACAAGSAGGSPTSRRGSRRCRQSA
jgi:hypothetical protein